ncbi:Cj0814 family flagellar-dependent secreted protein [Campylobacter taeniopygiae]|uniref:Cj0814 family flagellar-dependent secreted protein n=1 Tax=Campylobacter taeniopygiae TaxID=2510188 RepID=UPI003D6B1137
MSIFSINDNSNYTSILSQAKANKESKENSKINFANTFLKQNATKLNDIENKNSQTLIRSEVLDKQSNSINNNINKNYYTKTNSPNYDISSEFKNSIYTLKFKQADISNNTAYGYSVDKDDYMGEDFNEAAGLPKDFKIHKSTLDEIERVAENNFYNAKIKEYLGVDKYYDNIDMANTIKQYYNQFNQIINHTFNDTNKTSFSEADLNSLPKGVSYSSNDKTIGIMPKNYDKLQITNYYNTQEQYDEMEQLGTIASINTGLQPLNFTPQSMQTQNLDQDSARDTFNPDMSFYPKNEDGTYTKEDLFMSFLKSTGVPLREDSATLNPRIESYQATMAKESFDGSLASLDDIMTGKVDFASLLKGYAQDGWLDADIYAMEKGVKWQNSVIGYGGAWFDNQFNQAKANGWKASSESINFYVGSIMDRLNNLIRQTRV